MKPATRRILGSALVVFPFATVFTWSFIHNFYETAALFTFVIICVAFIASGLHLLTRD